VLTTGKNSRAPSLNTDKQLLQRYSPLNINDQQKRGFYERKIYRVGAVFTSGVGIRLGDNPMYYTLNTVQRSIPDYT
jgi:hypothetical protein